MALNTTPATWVAASTVTAAQMNTEIRDALTGIQAAWTSYSPAITTGGVAITIGNGTIDAAYTRFGKTVMFRVTLTVGSTTVLPAGAYAIPLPVTAKAANYGVGSFMSVTPTREGAWRNTTTTSVSLYEGGTAAAATVATLATVNGSIITLNGLYEAP